MGLEKGRDIITSLNVLYLLSHTLMRFCQEHRPVLALGLACCRYTRWLDSHLGSFECQCAHLQKLQTAGVRIFYSVSPLKRVECQPPTSRQDAEELKERACRCFAPGPQVLLCQQEGKPISQTRNGGQVILLLLQFQSTLWQKNQDLSSLYW